ncbi:MAG: hypothetical protein IJS08_18670 [Victivallales bacterium]|nr:hypothetical protein [Victivallales bacterium]
MKEAFYRLFSSLILFVTFCAYAKPEITDIKHDAAKGETIVRWSGIAENEGVIVYRSTTALDKGNLPFAKTYWFRLGSKEGVIKVKGTGTGHYRIIAFTANRSPKGELSEERQVLEKDRNLPSVRFSIAFQNGKASIATSAVGNAPPPFRVLLGRDDMNTKPRLLAETPWSEAPMNVPANFKEGFVSVVGSDGHGSWSQPLEWLYLGKKANLHINNISSIAKNKDIRLSMLHPVDGKSLHAELRVTNRGFKKANSKVRLSLKTADGIVKITKEADTGSIAPGNHKWVKFDIIPKDCGKNKASIEIICQEDGDISDNRLEFPLYVTKKPVYFLWYGFANDLEFANMANPPAQYKEDWQRRGAYSLPIVSRNTKAEYYLSAMKEHDGFQYDELGGTWKSEQFIPTLHEVSKRKPEGFRALWHIGASVQQPVKQAVLDGTVNLLMVELYYTDGNAQSRKKDLEKLEAQLKMLIKQGVAEKTIIGLGTKDTYKGWNTPESHADFLAEQLRLIRRVAPMMPGVAFFSAATSPVVRRRMDDLCRELFLEGK